MKWYKKKSNDNRCGALVNGGVYKDIRKTNLSLIIVMILEKID